MENFHPNQVAAWVATAAFVSMAVLQLHYTTGMTDADHILQGLILLFETVFPARISGYYVEGSHADATAMATSDLDLTIVFREQFTSQDEFTTANQVLAACEQLSRIELDVVLTDELSLRRQADPMFKLGARLLYGSEIRDTVTLMPITIWAHQRMHAAYWLMINALSRPKPVLAPLNFPQPNAKWYGYANRTMHLPDGREVITTRNLIRVTGWIATARIAFERQQFVVRKRDCLATYQATINDEWTELLEQIDRRCRRDWQYLIPATEMEQVELQKLLVRTLAFENDFLARYRLLLLAELTGTDPVMQQDALRRLEQTPFADPEVMAAVRNLARATEI